ncbi:MAG: hypothetical protein AAF799_23020 [Myxococcota bacterium]
MALGALGALCLGMACGTPADGSSATGTTGLTGILTTPMEDTGESADDSGDDDGGDKLDVGGGTDAGGPNGGDCPGGGNGMMGEDVEFSYIWVANSPQGTVSKIDTMTGTEVGRYATGPATQSEPSRTSVNLYGDVAVTNRGAQGGGGGGVTKIAARIDDCVDTNGNGTIETSSGATDVLPWGSDECVLWNIPLPSNSYEHGPRPTAWEGTVTQQGCASPSPRLWVGWYNFAGGLGVFHRMNGSTGAIEDTVEIPWNGLNFGPYGGAVNKDGDLWVIGWQLGPLVRIDGDTLDVERIEMPSPPLPDQQWSYGMSLDQYGNPWIASGGAAALYDITAGQWQFVSTGNQSMRGVMVDTEDRAWFAVDSTGLLGGCGIGLIDVNTRSVVAPAIQLPGCITPVGVSIDVEGFVWIVDQGSNQAFKVDPDTYQVQLTVPGLQAPYTYSDMTGAGLNLVINPPAG